MRKLLAFLLVAVAASANEISIHSLQSGWSSSATPLFDHGLHGEGQIIAILDTGLDYDSCYFAEADGSRPPVNTRVDQIASNPNRRKVIAYDFLYSCEKFPSSPYCDNPNDPLAYDNQGHGTHAAASAAGDRAAPIAHDYGDAIATGAKLVIQDAGLSPTDNCTSRPGIGCPVTLLPILDQAYRQGARIHSNSWGDRQGVAFPGAPPTANYSAAARDVDTFVYTHPDMLVVFNTGNYGSPGTAPPSSLSSPGCAKNTLQVGGTRVQGRNDDVLANFTLYGPTGDGRIKPDIVGPAYVLAGDSDGDVTSKNCDTTYQGGTSWAAPTIAGAAALVRQYYISGYYPSGAPAAANAFTPSAALLKATIIAAARQVPVRWTQDGDVATQPVPSYEQGFGFPVLDDALYFPGDKSKLRVYDVPTSAGLALGETFSVPLNVRGGTPFRAVLVWTDPPGTPRGATDPTPQLVNDLDLRVGSAWGNEPLHPGQRDALNNVEVVSMAQPASGPLSISVIAQRVVAGRQSFALVITGDFDAPVPPLARGRAARH